MERLVSKSVSSDRFGEAGLQKVLALERQAKAILRDSEAEARRIVAEAQQRAKELKVSMKAKAEEEAESALRGSLLEIEEEVRLVRDRAECEAEVWEEVAKTHFDQALAFILGMVSLTEGQKPWSSD